MAFGSGTYGGLAWGGQQSRGIAIVEYFESVSIDEAIIRRLSLTRLFSETIHTAEALTKRLSFTRLNSETVQSIEAMLRLLSLRRSVGESLSLEEVSSRNLVLRRYWNETIAIIETAKKIFSLSAFRIGAILHKGVRISKLWMRADKT
jgi:hypothetical protein